jgi:polyisoprenoid-binding protein YceI
MKKIKLVLATLTLLIASAYTAIQSVSWKVKEDAYAITFNGPKVEGTAKGLKATIVFDEAKPEKSKFSASIDVNTINTGNGMKNKHAKSEDALDAAKFPMITFESSSITGSNGTYTALGKLTIKGITKEISLPFTFQKGAESAFKSKFSILSKDYNITRSGVPDKFEIELNIPVTQ